MQVVIMMGYFGKIIKNTLMFAAVGAILAVAVGPVLLPVAEYLGLTSSMIPIVGEGFKKAIEFGPAANAAWGATFFGAFGGIEAAIEPVFNIFSSGKPRGHSVAGPTVHYSQQPDLAVAPELPSRQPELVVNNSRKFTDMLSASKAPANFQDKLGAEPTGSPDRTV